MRVAERCMGWEVKKHKCIVQSSCMSNKHQLQAQTSLEGLPEFSLAFGLISGPYLIYCPHGAYCLSHDRLYMVGKKCAREADQLAVADNSTVHRWCMSVAFSWSNKLLVGFPKSHHIASYKICTIEMFLKHPLQVYSLL